MSKKRNFIIYGTDGKVFTSSDNNSHDKIKEYDIQNDVFYGEKMKYTVIDTKEMLGYDIHDNIRIYFIDNDKAIWNNNRLISLYVGKNVNSATIVFVSENEMEYSVGEPMSYDMFTEIINTFITSMKQIMDDVDKDSPLKATMSDVTNKAKEDVKPVLSPLFKINLINYIFSACKEGVYLVEPGENKENYDTFWKKNYAGQYNPYFITQDAVEIISQTEKRILYVFQKAHLMTLYSPENGDIEIYGTGYSNAMYNDISNKVTDTIKQDPEKFKDEKLVIALVNDEMKKYLS